MENNVALQILSAQLEDETKTRIDAIGLEELELLLKKKINFYLNSYQQKNGRLRKGTLTLLANSTDVSPAHLYQFTKGYSICMQSINNLALYFDVSYLLTNMGSRKINIAKDNSMALPTS